MQKRGKDKLTEELGITVENESEDDHSTDIFTRLEETSRPSSNKAIDTGKVRVNAFGMHESSLPMTIE
jgi:RNA-binding protein YlmH